MHTSVTYVKGSIFQSMNGYPGVQMPVMKSLGQGENKIVLNVLRKDVKNAGKLQKRNCQILFVLIVRSLSDLKG